MTTPLEKAHKRAQELRESGELVRKNPLQKWRENDTRKSAIEASCWLCMGGTDDYAEGVRGLIRECSCGPDSGLPCPNWNWRPYK